MIHRATDCGLRLFPKHKVSLAPDANDVIHDPRQGAGRFLFRRLERTVPEGLKTVQVHESVVRRTRTHPNPPGTYDPWIKAHDPEVVST